MTISRENSGRASSGSLASNRSSYKRIHMNIPEPVVESWKSSFASTSKPGGFHDLKHFVVRLQATCRTHLSKQHSTSPQLTLTRYARAEAAVREALAQCEKEPTPLELQVREMERGLRVWEARVARGHERVKKSEEALHAMRDEEKINVNVGFSARVDVWNDEESRRSLTEMQKEKWMGMKERDEAMEMVGKIKELIIALNKEIKAGSKRSSLATLSGSGSTLPSSSPRIEPHNLHPDGSDPTTKAVSKKVSTLFSGRIPPPYLNVLPRSRRSVEPLRLPQQHRERERASLEIKSVPSTPSTPAPYTPKTSTSASIRTGTSISSHNDNDDEYGAVVIHASKKTVEDYLAEMEAGAGRDRRLGHVRLPSYVGTLLDEFSLDRIGSSSLELERIPEVLQPTPVSGSNHDDSNHNFLHPETPTKNSRAHKLLRRSRSNLSRVKENLDPASPQSTQSTPRPHPHPSEPITPRKKDRDPDRTPSRTSVIMEEEPVTPRKKHASMMGDMMRNVRRSVKKVSSKLTIDG
ncbi:hypothetical protein M422DRAFT_27120 [Sphaerobolus stellatus SS14]|nr:hypothetical protein M422DRAFT_27120 [Sphaerobolus stellatus SS14]